MTPDRNLILPQKVLKFTPSPLGAGYGVELECGHQAWSFPEPGEFLYCGACADRYATQTYEAARMGEPRTQKG